VAFRFYKQRSHPHEIPANWESAEFIVTSRNTVSRSGPDGALSIRFPSQKTVSSMHTEASSAKQQTTLRSRLGSVKRSLASIIRRSITGAPLPLGIQAWAVKYLLPDDPWPKCVAYQQCMADRIVRRFGTTVQQGPFKGMKYLDDAEDGCIVPKYLGCYEEELSPTIERFLQEGFDRVVDVGCASGYYVAGFAFKQPNAEAFGFDIDQPCLERAQRLVALNQLQSRVTLLELCTADELQRLVKGKTLIMMDCEGAEYDLLNMEVAPALADCDMIIEIHDMINPKISATLLERFERTHQIERIPTRTRQPDATLYPGLSILPPVHRLAAVDERRPCPMEWMIFRTRKTRGEN
jgi:hypothetical protein